MVGSTIEIKVEFIGSFDGADNVEFGKIYEDEYGNLAMKVYPVHNEQEEIV